ncbi:hypothetical protein DCAR_0521839 [Daucus carota subsp. sativus]|uniref:JmjC domain-containing protein n=1 Tax=Daucus carota subsp. sativus TaxID=79200 RepID=A0AAF1B1E1_DAUCS|nr:hypothetical protein DCAR_0521839 [Daucus carota subsp. sativus]
MPDPTHGCSCCNLAAGDDTATEKIRKAIDIQAGDHKHFQAHWSKGEPVIVTGGLDRTYGLSWEPMVMSRAMHDKSRTGVTVLNCLNWCKEEYSLSLFFKGYTEGRLDLAGWPQMLKLNDWPESGSFEDRLPRHNVEFLSALPFKEYTHPQSGYLNLAVKLPEGHLKPDTGPKLYTAYGFSQQLGRGDSVSKLSYHDSDAVYVLTHVKEMTFTPSELAKMEQLKEKHRVQDEREIYAEELQNPKSGALWDIYRREDAFKLKEYLRRHFKEFRHTYCLPLKQVVDPIYDGVFYLNAEHQRRLKEEYGIEPWRVVQNLGDAIFIPAGCPFQVRNLKSCIQVSTGFVSPESIHECLRFTEEIRVLPREHVAKEDKLGVKKLIIHAIRQVSNDLEEVTNLKKHMSGRLLDLADDPNLQDFNRVLHFLLASRRIPSHLQQGFLALRRDLPDLTSRAYELHKEVKRGMVMPLARSKEREELKSMLGKYRQIEENMMKLEKEKDTTMLSISRLQMRNEQLNEEVTNLRTAAENDVGDRSKLCNDEAWKLEEKIDHNSAEIVRLQATNEAIGAKLVKFSDEAKRLHKDAHAQHYKALNLEAMAAAYERNVENTMDKLVIMEQNWKQQVQALDY